MDPLIKAYLPILPPLLNCMEMNKLCGRTVQTPGYFLHHQLIKFVFQMRNSNLPTPIIFNFVYPSNFYHGLSNNKSCNFT